MNNMDEKIFLKQLSEAHGPSGKEKWLHPLIEKTFQDCCNIKKDNVNNLYLTKEGTGKGKIMIMAHCDEVFLMVSEIIDKGYLKVKGTGIDPKTLVSQKVLIHGYKKIEGIIGIKPPHLMNSDEREKAITIDEILVDTGYSKEELEEIVRVGDYITIKREMVELLNNNVACKCADDRAGIVAMKCCLDEIKNINHELDVCFVASCQEETGIRGARVATANVMPDIGIAIDTTFDSGLLGDQGRENKIGQGPVICIGPNIHPKVRKKIMAIAKEYNIPFQLEVEPGHTGTDAWNIQTVKEGVPTLLISIPIKHMHTSVELINIDDIKNTGRLIAKFIEKLKDSELEELLCF